MREQALPIQANIENEKRDHDGKYSITRLPVYFLTPTLSPIVAPQNTLPGSKATFQLHCSWQVKSHRDRGSVGQVRAERSRRHEGCDTASWDTEFAGQVMIVA